MIADKSIRKIEADPSVALLRRIRSLRWFAHVPSLVSDHDLAAANRAVQGSNTIAQVAGPGLVLWAIQGRQVPPGAYGLALSAAGIGALIGTLTALRLGDRLGFGRAFAVSLLLSCFVPLALAVFLRSLKAPGLAVSDSVATR